MKKIRPCFLIVAALQFLLVACKADMPEAKLTVTVNDSSGKPLVDAVAGAFFPHIYGAGASVKGDNVRVKTDQNGVAVLQGRFAGTVGGGVELSGYYRTQFKEIDFPSMLNRGEDLNAERTLILKKINNPIPLFARQFRNLKIPSLNEPFGYDVEIGDWIPPHGNGKTTDIIFQIKGKLVNYKDHDLTLEISFPNKGDGLMEFEGVREFGSVLRSDHQAPESGYNATLTLRRKALNGQAASQWINESKPGSNYYMRLRTKLDRKGNVLEANYGKIYGNIEFLDFIKAEAYYFNPTVNDRNIEFDTKRNLATPMKAIEKVSMP